MRRGVMIRRRGMRLVWMGEREDDERDEEGMLIGKGMEEDR